MINYSPPSFFLLYLSCYCWSHHTIWKTPLATLIQLFWLYALPTSCPCIDFSEDEVLEKQCWGCVSPVQQEPKICGITNTFTATNAKHRAVRAAVGKMNSISARHNTPRIKIYIDNNQWITIKIKIEITTKKCWTLLMFSICVF